MNDKNYTEEEIMSALELRIYRDTLCRESYELIKAKNLEIERLKTNLNVYGQELQRKKAEAIKEFAERLKTHTRKMQSSDFSGEFWDRAVLASDIDNLIKEMEGD